METTEANLEIKVTQLDMAVDKTNTVLHGGKNEAIERHISSFKYISSEINHMRLNLEASKLAAKEEMTAIEEWNARLDAKLEKADSDVAKCWHVAKARKWLDDRKGEEESNAQEHVQKLYFEQKLHQTKLEMQTELTASQASQHTPQALASGDIQAKLPKLVITKFDGTFMDWPRFWRQFSETIDKTSVAAITKFSYLRELLDSKVRKTVEALPFTSEGYNRAKSILQEKFGKESEVVKAYTREILDLPTIPNSNPKKISEFSEKLTYCVQALETLKRLEQVNGAVSMTLDKLPAIRGDLVQTDPDWERWDFTKLSEAVRLWVRKNPVETTRSERDQEQVVKRIPRPTKIYHARREDWKPRGCVYCGEDHRPVECTRITNLSDRRQILLNKRLCFNCTSEITALPIVLANRLVNAVTNATIGRSVIQHTHQPTLTTRRHKQEELTTNQLGEGLFPVLVVEVNGIKCRALVDSGAGSSYVSAKLIDLLRVKPTAVQQSQSTC